MKEYECKLCNFKTFLRGDYKRHCDRSKHIQKTHSNTDDDNNSFDNNMILIDSIKMNYYDDSDEKNKKYICNKCDNDFTRASSLTRHQKVCCTNDTLREYEKELGKKEQELEIKEKEIEHQKELKEIYKIEKEICQKELEYYKNILNVTGGMVQKTVGALTHVVKTYDNAPAIQQITFKEFEKIKGVDGEKLIDEIFYHYHHNKIGQYLGNIIVQIYMEYRYRETNISFKESNI